MPAPKPVRFDATVTVHPLPRQARAPAGPPVTPEEGPPSKLAFAPLEQAALRRLVRDGADAIVEHAANRATAYAHDPGSRLRALARSAARVEAEMTQLELVLQDLVARRDFGAALAVNRILDSATRRYTAFMAELRLESGAGIRTPVVIGAAQSVTIRAP